MRTDNVPHESPGSHSRVLRLQLVALARNTPRLHKELARDILLQEPWQAIRRVSQERKLETDGIDIIDAADVAIVRDH